MVRALTAARELGVHTIGLLGRAGGDLGNLADLTIIVPSNDTARIQEAHIFLGHGLCGLVEDALADAIVVAGTSDASEANVLAVEPCSGTALRA